MKCLLTLLAATVLGAVMLLPTAVRADSWPTFGTVTTQNSTANYPVYTPGFSFDRVASNGAIHSYYAPGHPTNSGDQGQFHYVPAFRSNYQAPGSVHNYYGSYSPLRTFYDNRR